MLRELRLILHIALLVSMVRAVLSPTRDTNLYRLREFKVDTQQGHVTLSAQAREALGLQSQEVSVGAVQSTLVSYAETVAPWQAKAFGSAQISGRITKLLVSPGDVVSKGQTVAELSSRELETLRLSFLQAKNDVALNRKLLDATARSPRRCHSLAATRRA